MDDDPNKLINDLFTAVEEKNGGKLTPDQLSRISLKLGEMLGNPGSHEVTQNEKGQILNEEGLPVIEITEQVGPEQASSSNGITPPFSADLPMWALSEEEKARNRTERERILDMLEEEERIEEEQKVAEEEESRAAKRKRLQAARELQKAMGRTLVKNVKDFKEREEQAKSALLKVDKAVGAEKSKRSMPKKSVSFDLPPEESPVSPVPQQDWGDVTPARLQLKPSSASDPHGAMQLQVVERFPRGLQSGSPFKDSDDESDPEPVPDSEEERPSLPMKQVEFHSDESTEDGGDFELQEGETDLAAAQHQREIALAYYEKREKFATQAAAAFSSHSHVEEDPWDRPEVPLEANLAGGRPKPAISKFKADQIVSSSTSLDGLVVPASQSALMRGAVRLGKLEGDQLVGGPEDSDDDLKEIAGLIGQGEVENIGPNLPNRSPSQTADQDFSTLPLPKARKETSRFKINRGGVPKPSGREEKSGPLLNLKPPTPVATDVTERRGTLQLKPDHTNRSTPPSPVPDTPLTAAERSSPKLPSGDIPVFAGDLLSGIVSNKPVDPAESTQSTSSTVREPSPASETGRGRAPGSSKTHRSPVVELPLSKQPLPFAPPEGHNPAFPPMVIDSPDFPPPGVATMPSMIIDSPDFPPPKDETPIPPMGIGSPGFPSKRVSPTSTTIPVNTPTPLVIDSPSFPAEPRYLGPPRVMSSQVVERSPLGVNQPRQEVPGKKVSRFAGERR